MASRKALVIINGEIQQLPAGDTLDGAGSGGHTIKDETTTFTARTNLKFMGTTVVEDDASGDNTKINTPGADIFLALTYY